MIYLYLSSTLTNDRIVLKLHNAILEKENAIVSYGELGVVSFLLTQQPKPELTIHSVELSSLRLSQLGPSHTWHITVDTRRKQQLYNTCFNPQIAVNVCYVINTINEY